MFEPRHAPPCRHRVRWTASAAPVWTALCSAVLVAACGAAEPSFEREPLLLAMGTLHRRGEVQAETYRQSNHVLRLESDVSPTIDQSAELGLELMGRARPFVFLPHKDYEDLEAERPRLTTASLDADEQRSIVGGRLLVATPTASGRVLSEVRLLWLCEFLQSPGASTTAFFSPGESAVFATQGLSYGANWLMGGTRWRWELAGGLGAFAGYDAQFNSQQMFHIGSTGLDFRW